MSQMLIARTMLAKQGGQVSTAGVDVKIVVAVRLLSIIFGTVSGHVVSSLLQQLYCQQD